jgi:hypothetical protein
MVASRRQPDLVLPLVVLIVLIAIGGVALAFAVSSAGTPPYTTFQSSSPAAGITQGTITIVDAAARITITSGDVGDQLYRAKIDHVGSAPRFSYANGDVRIERDSNVVNFWGRARDVVELVVSPAVPWSISIDAAGTTTGVDLSSGWLRSLKVNGAGGDLNLTAGQPHGVATVRFDGVGTAVTLAMPAGAEYRATADGVATRIDGLAESAGWSSAADRYDIALNGVGVHATVTAS